MEIQQTPSPNFSSRNGYKPEAIVIHCTAGFFPSDLGWLRNPVSQASSHYYIDPDGQVHQLVQDNQAAWCVGVVKNPTWKGYKPGKNPNWYSLSVEVSLNPPAHMWGQQETALKELVLLLAKKHDIPLDRDHIIGHKEIRADKTCPGTIDVDALVKSLSSVDKEAIKKEIHLLVDKMQEIHSLVDKL